MQTDISCETLWFPLQPLSFLFSACSKWERWRMKWVWSTFLSMTWQPYTKWQELHTKWTILHRRSSTHHPSRCSIHHPSRCNIHLPSRCSMNNCKKFSSSNPKISSSHSQLLSPRRLHNNNSQHLCNKNQSSHLSSRSSRSSHSNSSLRNSSSYPNSNLPPNTSLKCLFTRLSFSQESLKVTVLTFERTYLLKLFKIL